MASMGQSECFSIFATIFHSHHSSFSIKNSQTRSEIEKLLSENNYSELKSRLMERMEFGTAGLRARMGAGYSMMNDLTIIQSTQGFLQYLKTFFGEQLIRQGVIIGFDARHNSRRFAQLAANVFLKAQVPVYLYRDITPTPFVVRIFFSFLFFSFLFLFI
jgi:phosphoglucomutase/phosphopentomutase